MNKTLAILTLLFLFACQPKEEAVDYAVIAGKIDHFEQSEINLAAINGEFNRTIALKDDGSFRDTLKSFPKTL